MKRRSPLRAGFRGGLGGLVVASAVGLLSGPSGAQPIERLLLTPQQRLELERLRAVHTSAGTPTGTPLAAAVTAAPGGAVAAPVGAASAPGTERVPRLPQRVEGWVLRSGGHSTVWVDGVPYYGFDAQGPARDELGRRGLLGPGGAASGLRAQPGQVVDEGARRTTDLLPDGALRIQRPGAAAPAR